MAIVLYAEIVGGLGDILFGFNALAALRDAGYTQEMVLVLGNHQYDGRDPKKLVANLGLEKQYGILALSPEEYAKKKKENFRLDFLIVGPISAYIEIPFLVPKGQESVPTLLVPEYGASDRTLYGFVKYLLDKTDKAISMRLLCPGFGLVPDALVPERGVFLNKYLVDIGNKTQANDYTFRAQCWSALGEELAAFLLQGKSIEAYHRETDLFFAYSAKSPEDFFDVQQFLTKENVKNQDIFCVSAPVMDFARVATSTLKENGFQYVLFVNLDDDSTTVFYDSAESQTRKTCRFFYKKYIPHDEFISMLALSHDLVRVTGDQSFGEAFSAGKIIYYEALRHKYKFIGDFWDKVLEKAEAPALRNAVEIFRYGGISGESQSIDALTLGNLKEILFRMRSEYDFGAVLAEKLNSSYSLTDMDELNFRLFLCFHTGKNEENLKDLLAQGGNPLEKNSEGDTIAHIILNEDEGLSSWYYSKLLSVLAKHNIEILFIPDKSGKAVLDRVREIADKGSVKNLCAMKETLLEIPENLEVAQLLFEIDERVARLVPDTAAAQKSSAAVLSVTSSEIFTISGIDKNMEGPPAIPLFPSSVELVNPIPVSEVQSTSVEPAMQMSVEILLSTQPIALGATFPDMVETVGVLDADDQTSIPFVETAPVVTQSVLSTIDGIDEDMSAIVLSPSIVDHVPPISVEPSATAPISSDVVRVLDVDIQTSLLSVQTAPSIVVNDVPLNPIPVEELHIESNWAHRGRVALELVVSSVFWIPAGIILGALFLLSAGRWQGLGQMLRNTFAWVNERFHAEDVVVPAVVVNSSVPLHVETQVMASPMTSAAFTPVVPEVSSRVEENQGLRF